MEFYGDRGCSISSASVTPASYVPGDTLKISFKISLTSKASGGDISGSVEVALGVGSMDGGEPSGFNGEILKRYTKQSIKRGASKTYTFSLPVTYAPRAPLLNSYPGDFLWLSIEAQNTSGGYYNIYVSDAVIWLNGRDAPEIGGALLSDRAVIYTPSTIQGSSYGAPTGTTSPLGYFGGIIQNKSLPQITLPFHLDHTNQNDITFTATHAFSYSNGGVTKSLAASTEYGANTISFDLDAPTSSGEVEWTYTVTDSYGLSATKTGSFNVVAYTPPVISSFLLERYTSVIDAGGQSHVPADDGEMAWLSLNISVTPISSKNVWYAQFKAWPENLTEPIGIYGEGVYLDTSGTRHSMSSWSLNGSDGNDTSMTRDELKLADFSPNANTKWLVRFTVHDTVGNSTTIICDDLDIAGSIFNIEPNGIGMGMHSKGAPNEYNITTGEISVINQAVDVAEDWILRVHGPMSVADNQFMRVVAVPVTVTISSGRNVTATIAAATLASSLPTGFTPLGVAGVFAHSDYWYPYRFYINDSKELILSLARYTGSVSSSTTLNNTVYVLCIRTT